MVFICLKLCTTTNCFCSPQLIKKKELHSCLVNVMSNRNVCHNPKHQVKPQRQCETVSRTLLAQCTRTTEVFNLLVSVEIFSIEVCSVELADVVRLCSDTIYKQSLVFPFLYSKCVGSPKEM